MESKLKYYEYNFHKIYVFILTISDTLEWRKKLVEDNIKCNPKINKLIGIDANDKEKIRLFIKDNEITIPSLDAFKRPDSEATYGKLGRWLATILIAKLSLDTNSNIIILEDDLCIPENFDFQFDKWFTQDDTIIRLGIWGDGYFFNPKSSKKFLEIVNSRWINLPNDRFIILYTPNKRYHIISRNKYGHPNCRCAHTVHSSIFLRNDIIDFTNKPIKTNKLLEKKILGDINKFNGDLSSLRYK